MVYSVETKATHKQSGEQLLLTETYKQWLLIHRKLPINETNNDGLHFLNVVL